MSSLAKALFLYLLHAFIRRTLVYGVTNAVTLSCHASHMFVQVNLKYFRWLDPQSLHLRHHSCSSNNYTKTSASFVVPLYGCGTRRRTYENLLIYKNAVSNSNRNFSFISRVPYVRMPFYCVYRRRYSLLLRTGTTSKKHVAKKIKKPQQEGSFLEEEHNRAVNLTDSSTGSLHCISTSILWITSIGVVLLA